MAIKAFISNPDFGVTALRPDLYSADARWLELTQRDEVSTILADTQRAEYVPGFEGQEHLAYTILTRDYDAFSVSSQFLAEAIERMLPEFHILEAKQGDGWGTLGAYGDMVKANQRTDRALNDALGIKERTCCLACYCGDPEPHGTECHRTAIKIGN